MASDFIASFSAMKQKKEEAERKAEVCLSSESPKLSF